MKTANFKGYMLALIATIAFSNVYIFSKAALNEIHLTQFGIYWCGLGVLFSFLFALKNKKLGQLKVLDKKQRRILLMLGVLEILTTTTFFISINIIPDPSITSFIGNLFPVMVTLGGIVLLKERFGWIEIVGASLALIGTFVISYTGGTSLRTLFIAGTGVVVINAIFATTATLIVKVHVKNISPELFNLNRYTWLFTFSLIAFFVYQPEAVVPSRAFANISIGAFLEFVAILTVYYSYQFIDASRSAVVQTLKGIFVLIGAYLVFHTFPALHQFIGGMITVIGVLIMTLAQAGIFKSPTARLN
ncbi:DMT family transporter [uncultured Draconibacterium sp.]|uniref:DMT family transporter n=1 Tax=uncultured Draconibacterium sp. TaxID=1573823 RepID=UPI0029C0C81D|nr:DMT family transporter [uncultured Draconibacterium sp.]